MIKGQKHSQKTKNKMSKIHKIKGSGKWMIGRKLSEKTKKKISEANKRNGNKPPSAKGKKRSKEFKEKLRIANLGNKYSLGRKLSKESRRKIGLAHTGEKSSFWKGGITPLVKQIRRNLFEYRQWRSDVFTRDDFTCQNCGKRGGDLEAHHIKEFHLILQENKITNLQMAIDCEELWNINNGLTLCKKCHNLTKNGRNKKQIN